MSRRNDSTLEAYKKGWSSDFALETVWQDFRYSVRQLRRNPGFAITTILTLALGIGATTAVFSVVYGVLIDPYPYKDVKTLATPKLCWPDLPTCGSISYTPQQFLEIAQKTDIFSDVTASAAGLVTLTGGPEQPERISGTYITPNTFDLLGVDPLLGRAAIDGDAQTGHEEVALLSYRYWHAHFGGSTSILGRVLDVNGRPRMIIGVMPPRFLWLGADVYLPIAMKNQTEIEGQRDFTLLGRLKPGVTEAQAAVELKSVFDDFEKAAPSTFPKELRFGILTFPEQFKSDLASTLYLLLGSVLLLLLIACVNVSSLLLARAVNREHEFVLRASIGASRMRLVRQSLTESLLLAVAAMPFALTAAYTGLKAILRIVPTDTIPDSAVVGMNVPVLLGSLGIALSTVMIFGLAPAWHSANPRLAAVLNSFRSSSGRTQRRLLSSFVIAEIALSMGLLMLAGLMLRSLIAVENVPVPFPPDHTLLMELPLKDERYSPAKSQLGFFQELLSRVRALPGVVHATLDAAPPFMGIFTGRVQIGNVQQDHERVSIHLTDPAYLDVSGRKMMMGHFVDEREIRTQSHDVIVTERFVKRYFAGRDPLGQTIHLPDLTKNGKILLADDSFIVVGVTTDLPLFGPRFKRTLPELFLPYTVAPTGVDNLIITTKLPANVLLNPVRQLIYSIDKDQPIVDPMSLRQMLDRDGYAGPRFAFALFGTFAATALGLSLVGIFGVLSFITSKRTQEIGIRMALGASRSGVMWMVLRHACLLAMLGAALGLPLALAAGQFAKRQLIQTSQYDPVTLVLVICILPLLAIAGTLLPARRAAAVEPAKTLRGE